MDAEYKKKLIWYATAKRCTAEKLHQYIDGDFVMSWVGKVRGTIVKTETEFKHDTKAQALAFARKWRDDCIAEAEKKGVDLSKGLK